jgi:hypothetical protein
VLQWPPRWDGSLAVGVTDYQLRSIFRDGKESLYYPIEGLDSKNILELDE